MLQVKCEMAGMKGRTGMTRNGWQNKWIRTVTTLLTAMVMVMIFCFSMENAAESDQRSGSVSMIYIRIMHPEYELMDEPLQSEMYNRVQFAVRKCAHFTEYLLLGFMIRLCLESWIGHRIRKRNLLPGISITAGILYACTDEFHQTHTEGRSGAWTDVLVDSCGVLAGMLLGTVLIRYTERKNKRND